MATISTSRAEKIARNINAMDVNFSYSDDMRTYRFFSKLEKQLREILSTLSQEDKLMIAQLCNDAEAAFFGLNKEELTKTEDMKTPTTSFRKTVMLRAYHIMATTGKEWAICLKKAWQLYRLNKEMHKGEVTFYFEKKDGSLRKAVGSLKMDSINYEFKTDNQPKVTTFTYFDIEANSFRSFKIENFMMVEQPRTPEVKATAVLKKTPAKLIRIRRTHLKSA
ncbi:SH3 beta-barrel fold-containing protein [Chryseobacterium turcicum]|uniref:SH3 beta-barrel fold-containing protein n=1 Tax=Chryseobacterium turcicum TaxID=2898076 RepID=A0A9Q3V1H0_9FLAO|nr:SH3 beta-barrel fold-containing protein [Chryseobacterium turcicum]MCD1115595.1 SH3 beta-barrel fold-containing protein [Chryseobacterium turcicum]